jgi:uncharacterized protein (DUF885 family)
LLITAALAFSGAAGRCEPATAQPGSDRQFRAIVARFIDREMRLYPERATEDGDHRFDNQLSDYSPSGIRAKLRHAHYWKTRFSSWRGALSPSNEADREWLAAHADEELLWNEEVRFYRSDPALYLPTAAVDSLIKRDFAPLAQRMESVAARERRRAPI